MRLYRSRTNAMLGGVAGGLGEYLNIDPTFVRLFFVLLALGSGIGVLLYLLLWIILPREDQLRSQEGAPFRPGEFANRAGQMGREFGEAVSRPNPATVKWIGGGLILAGIFFLLENLNLPWLSWFQRELLWPLLLIVAGAALLLRAVRGE